MNTYASIFSGGELAGIGAVQAGLTPIWGVEHDADIAAVAEQNVNSRMIVARAQDVDYSQLESPFWLHMSPPCVNASVAKSDARETEEDKDMARACARAISILKPSRISLENVWNYRTFESFQIICNELALRGYHFRFWHLNSANYGVPQTRKRLILVASLSSVPVRPHPTHTSKTPFGLFDSLPQWVGWYESIEDLIPTLPESEFAEWQLKRIPVEYIGPFLCMTGNTSDVQAAEGVGIVPAKPANSVYAQPPSARAFIVEATAAGEDNKFSLPVRHGADPIFTVRSGSNYPRAFIIDGKPANYAGDLQIMDGDSPVVTVTASQDRHPFRAWLSRGRVVSMTVRANARFQSIPDAYILPDNNKLASRIVGNAVPPLLMRRIVGAQNLYFDVKEQVGVSS